MASYLSIFVFSDLGLVNRWLVFSSGYYRVASKLPDAKFRRVSVRLLLERVFVPFLSMHVQGEPN